MSKLLPVQEIGSLAKPAWRVKSIAGRPLTDADIHDAVTWGQRIGVDTRELVTLLRKPSRTPEDQARIVESSALFGIRFLEAAGLDIVYDAEQRRTEMYEAAAEHIEGYKFLGHVRSFDNKYYKKAAVVQEPRLAQPLFLDEVGYVLRTAKGGPGSAKVPVTGAFTMADWSFNEHYLGQRGARDRLSRDARHDAARDLTIAVAREVLRPTLQAWLKAGVKRVQIDEPAAATKPDQVDVMVEGFNEAVRGLEGRFSVHFCFSDYRKFYPGILELKNCAEYAMEFANRDSPELGLGADQRNGYATQMQLMEEYGDPADLGLGVADVHVDAIERPELIRDRLLFAAKHLGPERVIANPDCGLRTRSWEVAFQKLQSISKGAAMARQQLASK